MTSTAAFLSGLIRAANAVDRLTRSERAKLLERAAVLLHYLSEIAQLPHHPANQNGRSVKELREMARLIFIFRQEEIAAKMLEGAETIRTLAILLGIKDEVSGEDT